MKQRYQNNYTNKTAEEQAKEIAISLAYIPDDIKHLFNSKHNKMKNFEQAFLEELGANNVKDIQHDGTSYIMSFNNGEPQKFEDFESMYEWLSTEGND